MAKKIEKPKDDEINEEIEEIEENEENDEIEEKPKKSKKPINIMDTKDSAEPPPPPKEKESLDLSPVIDAINSGFNKLDKKPKTQIKENKDPFKENFLSPLGDW